MFQKRSYKKELMDDLTLSSAELGQNLEELRVVNRYLGGNLVLKVALNRLKKQGFFKENKIYRIADIGSGGGDNLIVIAEWFQKNNLQVALTGIDANAFMIGFASDFCRKYPNIQFAQYNIFDTAISQLSFDLTTCSLFCHHFTDEELLLIFKNIKSITQGAFIINDLHRHPIAYGGIWFLTRLLNGSYLIKNDAPLSVLRAFRRKEIQTLTEKVFPKVTVNWIWAFRWMVICRL
jgi:2-polyprenyl-3-methyl-5-hydroxy-6-metoxy-1,4-benzoquinol methylase